MRELGTSTFLPSEHVKKKKKKIDPNVREIKQMHIQSALYLKILIFHEREQRQEAIRKITTWTVSNIALEID